MSNATQDDAEQNIQVRLTAGHGFNHSSLLSSTDVEGRGHLGKLLITLGSDFGTRISCPQVKKLIKSLNAARGAGTSMISLIIPPKAQISQIQN
ncbi:hypothetical protein FRB99_004024, partial [Tulasnella sp. 403]